MKLLMGFLCAGCDIGYISHFSSHWHNRSHVNRDSPASMHVRPTTVSDEHPLHTHTHTHTHRSIDDISGAAHIYLKNIGDLHNHNTGDSKSAELFNAFDYAQNKTIFQSLVTRKKFV